MGRKSKTEGDRPREWVAIRLRIVNRNGSALARALGITPSRVTEIINGTREVGSDELPKMASFLEMSVEDLVAALGLKSVDPFKIPRTVVSEARALLPSNDLPLYGTALGGPIGSMTTTTSPIGLISRPHFMVGSDDSFALLMAGAEMEPRYSQGDTILVHPAAPVSEGNHVCVVLRVNPGEPRAVLIRKLIERDEEYAVVWQHSPPGALRLGKDEIESIWRVTGSLEPH